MKGRGDGHQARLYLESLAHNHRKRYAVEPNAPVRRVFCNETLTHEDAWALDAHPYACETHRQQRWHPDPLVYLGLCWMCGNETAAGARFIRSPRWDPDVAMFACGHMLKQFQEERIWHWRPWHMAWFVIFMRYPAMLAAKQAIDAWGRKWFLMVPAPIYFTDIDPPPKGQ
jgi:hypothetical protein